MRLRGFSLSHQQNNKRTAPGGPPVRVERSRIKVALLIACQYPLSRPIKVRKTSTGFV